MQPNYGAIVWFHHTYSVAVILTHCNN